MRIAFFTDSFYPELSGITDAITILGKGLAERGHHVLFVAPHYSKHDYKKANFKKSELDLGPNISVKRLPSFKTPDSPNGQGRIGLPIGVSIPYLKKFKPDVIHTQTPFGPGLEALLDAKILKVPLVGTNHTPFSEFMAYTPIRNKWATKKMLNYFSWYYNKCLFTTTPCQSLLDEMQTYGFKKPGQMLPNAIELDRFSPIRNDEEKNVLKKEYRLSPHTVLYTGRLAPEKKIDVTMRAIALAKKEIPDIQFAITGHGSAAQELKNLAKELGIEENVHFLGFVDKAIFPDLYRASDLFVIMSTAESQSLSLMQAMASGLPAIGADARALPEYIDKQSGVIVPVGDHHTLAKEMVRILNDKNLAYKLGQGGVRAVKQYHTDIIVSEWEKIYKHAIEIRKK